MGLKRKEVGERGFIQSCGSLHPCRVLHLQQHQIHKSGKIAKFRALVSILDSSWRSEVLLAPCVIVWCVLSLQQRAQFRHIAPSHGLTQKFSPYQWENRGLEQTATCIDAILQRQIDLNSVHCYCTTCNHTWIRTGTKDFILIWCQTPVEG